MEGAAEKKDEETAGKREEEGVTEKEDNGAADTDEEVRAEFVQLSGWEVDSKRIIQCVQVEVTI